MKPSQQIVLSIIGGLILSLIQVAFVPNLRIYTMVPNLAVTVLVLAVFYGLNGAPLWFAAGVTGLILDLYQTGRFGLTTLTVLFLVFLTVMIDARFIRGEQIGVSLLWVALMVAIFDIVGLLTSNVSWRTAILMVVGDVLYSSAAAAVLWLFLLTTRRRLHPVKV